MTFSFFCFPVLRLSPHPASLSTLVLAWIAPHQWEGRGSRPESMGLPPAQLHAGPECCPVLPSLTLTAGLTSDSASPETRTLPPSSSNSPSQGALIQHKPGARPHARLQHSDRIRCISLFPFPQEKPPEEWEKQKRNPVSASWGGEGRPWALLGRRDHS